MNPGTIKERNMTTSVLSLPVSIEQIAAAIKQMERSEQQRLLTLVPELRELASLSPSRAVEQMQESVRQLRAELLARQEQLIAPDAPFLGDITCAQYHTLPDAEKARLWDEWSDCDLLELDEQYAESLINCRSHYYGSGGN